MTPSYDFLPARSTFDISLDAAGRSREIRGGGLVVEQSARSGVEQKVAKFIGDIAEKIGRSE